LQPAHSRAYGLPLESGGQAIPILDTDDPAEFLASVADKIDGFLYRCLNDEDYTMLRLTSGFDRLFGRSSAGMVVEKRSFAKLIEPGDLKILRGAIDRAIAADRRWRVLYRFQHADGRWLWVYETGGGVRDKASGQVKYLDGVVLDISQFDSWVSAEMHDVAIDLA